MNGLEVGYSSSDESDGFDKVVNDNNTGKMTFSGPVEVVFQDPKLFDLRKRLHSTGGDINKLKATRAMKKARKAENELNAKELVSDIETRTPIQDNSESEFETNIDSSLGSKQPAIELQTNVSNIYIPQSRLKLTTAPKVYQNKFPMLIPGFKTYYTPKKLIKDHSTNDGKYAITSLRFHPKFGHVYVTATNSPNGIIKLWDTINPGKLIRDFIGHLSPIITVNFNEDGDKMVSLSKDGWIKIWDVQFGKVVFESKFIKSTTVKFIPNFNEILIGFDNGHIEQVDYTKAGPEMIIQTYDNHHQGPITDLEFIKPWYLPCNETHDGLPSLRFISTGFDKIINVWTLKINMPEKHITLNKSIHRMCIHPTGGYFICEEVGGGLLTYTTGSGETSSSLLSKKIHTSLKTFTNMDGDQILCTPLNQGPTFTPDGKTLVIGTSKGEIYFWDWKSARVVRMIQLDVKKIGAISSISIHPLETSLIIVGGENGIVGILN